VLEGLPARQRAALTLRYVHDLPDAAIARALRCRHGTVRSLLSRGREAVRAALDDEQRSPHA
jgi:RNA polymerase sigma-70 factor (ECF subfamily)